VFKEKNVVVGSGFGEEVLFFDEADEWLDVNGGDEGEGDVGLGWDKVGHEDEGAVGEMDEGDKLTVGVAVEHTESDVVKGLVAFAKQVETATRGQGQEVVGEEGGTFAFVGVDCPIPVGLRYPVGGVWEDAFGLALGVKTGSGSDMVVVEVGEENIGDVVGGKADEGEGFQDVNVGLAVADGVVFFVALVSKADVNKQVAMAVLYKEAAGGDGDGVVVVGLVLARP